MDVQNNAIGKRVDPIKPVSEISCKRIKKDDEFSIFFNNRMIEDNETDKKDGSLSKKKLINILEDVKLDKSDTYNIVSKVQLNKLKEVDVISKDIQKENKEPAILDDKVLMNINS